MSAPPTPPLSTMQLFAIAAALIIGALLTATLALSMRP